MAKCRKEQRKKGNDPEQRCVEYGRALNHCVAKRLCKPEAEEYGRCWSSWVSCGYYRGKPHCNRELEPMFACLERALGEVPGGKGWRQF